MPDYLPAVYPWYLQVETFALLGIVIGKTAWDKKYLLVITTLTPFLWVFNYLYLAEDHKFNWFGSFQTTFKMKNNLTHNSHPVKEEFSLFTPDDIGAIGLALTSYFMLMFSFYCMRKHMFGIIWWKKGEKEIEVPDKWTGYLVKKFTKNWDIWTFIRLLILWGWFVIFQGFLPIVFFQAAHQHPKWGSGHGLNQRGNSWNLAWFGGFLLFGWISSFLVWFIWAWQVDPERDIMLSQKFPREKGSQFAFLKGYPWYILYEFIFFAEMAIFGFLQSFRNIAGAWEARVYYTFGIAVVISLIHLGLAIGFHLYNHYYAISGRKNLRSEKYKEMEEEVVEA